jgi:hypothetical protein
LMSATVVDKSVDILCGMQLCYHGSCSFWDELTRLLKLAHPCDTGARIS